MNSINKLFETVFSPLAPFSLWIVRFTLGVSFFLHGWGKLPLPPTKLMALFERIGMVAPELMANLVALGEIGAGAGILLGGILKSNIGNIITRVSALGITIIMIGAFYFAHSDWFINAKLFKSEQIFLFALALFFLINGNKR
jgi:putative oxidoreductase